MTEAVAPGKIILCGEHSVVYGRPALAVPVWDVTARATVSSLPVVDSYSDSSDSSVDAAGSGCVLIAHDIDETIRLESAPMDNPLAFAARAAFAELGIDPLPDWRVDLRSTIPIAGGLGSGAAVSAALVRALFDHAGVPVSDAKVSELVYGVEALHHGTPSGVDNTVIAYGAPVWFVKGADPLPFTPRLAFRLVIADSGIPGPTRETVGDVRRGWLSAPERYDAWFDEIGDIVRMARALIEAPPEDDALPKLGTLFNQNQQVLAKLGVSSAVLDGLIDAAMGAGAFGAKLSGGGRGGNVIALVDAAASAGADAYVADAMMAAGAKRVISTRIGPDMTGSGA